jgi:hypothetical protein
MDCERCTGGVALYRAYTDQINMKVCEPCAREARRLGIAVEVLQSENKVAYASHSAASGWSFEVGNS